jgi:hypothetical protein
MPQRQLSGGQKIIVGVSHGQPHLVDRLEGRLVGGDVTPSTVQRNEARRLPVPLNRLKLLHAWPCAGARKLLRGTAGHAHGQVKHKFRLSRNLNPQTRWQ